MGFLGDIFKIKTFWGTQSSKISPESPFSTIDATIILKISPQGKKQFFYFYFLFLFYFRVEQENVR